MIPPGMNASAAIVGSGGAFSSSSRKMNVERLGFVKPGVAEWLLRGANDEFILGLTRSRLTSRAAVGFGASEPAIRHDRAPNSNQPQHKLGLVPKTTCWTEITRAVYGETTDKSTRVL